MALDGSSALLYMLIPAALLLVLLGLCLALGRLRGAREPDSSPLRTPLLPGDSVRHRVDAAMRDAEAGFSLCAACGFANFKRAASCSLCGERLASRSADPLDRPRTRRSEWTRKVDVEGKFFWFRASAAGDPGVCVLFHAPPAESLLGKDGVSASESVELPLAVAAVRMELLDAAAANPAMLSTGALISSASERVQELLALAAKDFPTKYAHFVASTAALIVPADVAFLKLAVHRDYMLEQSVDHLSCIEAADVHSHLRITFIDESAVDAGGVHREWFLLVGELLLSPALALFRCCNKREQTYYLSPSCASSSCTREEHVTYAFVAGRLVGRALLEGEMLGFHLSPPLLKLVLGIPVTLVDLELIDPEAYRSMLWLRDHDGADALALDFSVTETHGDGVVTVVDLAPGGRDIAVTDANKLEYLERRFRYLVFESVASQLYAFLKGVHEVIPPELLMLFDADELDFLLCGTQEIDVDDWQASSVESENLRGSSVARSFWEVVHEMPSASRRRLLQFATGTSRVPLSGFAGLTSYDGRLCPFSLNGVPGRYISSHACFNHLDLPLLATKRELETVLFATLKPDVFGFTTA